MDIKLNKVIKDWLILLCLHMIHEINAIKGALSGLRQFLGAESPLKIL